MGYICTFIYVFNRLRQIYEYKKIETLSCHWLFNIAYFVYFYWYLHLPDTGILLILFCNALCSKNNNNKKKTALLLLTNRSIKKTKIALLNQLTEKQEAKQEEEVMNQNQSFGKIWDTVDSEYIKTNNKHFWEKQVFINTATKKVFNTALRRAAWINVFKFLNKVKVNAI